MPKVAMITLAGLAASASAQPCISGKWASSFAEGSWATHTLPVTPVGTGASAVFDPDGPGPEPARLVVIASVRRPDGSSEQTVISWDGRRWLSMNASLPTPVNSLCVLHDPSNGNEVLYAMGYNGNATFMRWNGASWVALPQPLVPMNYLIAPFDPDGPGPRPEVIIAAGDGYYFGGSPAASWDGNVWTSLPSFGGLPTSMTTYTPPGGTPLLCVGSSAFSTNPLGGASYLQVRAWDGTSQTTLLDDLCFPCSVRSFGVLAALSDQPGGGSSLYATGSFSGTPELTGHRIGRWDGTVWHAADTGIDPSLIVSALGVVGTSTSPTLLGATRPQGSGPGNLIRWNGSSWSSPLTSFDAPIGQLITFNDGVDSVFAVGNFTIAGNVYATNLARTIGPLDLNGPNTIWAPVGQSLNNSVHALAGLASASGSLSAGLYAGGAFYTAGSSLSVSIARWDGASWYPLGVGANNHVDALTIAPSTVRPLSLPAASSPPLVASTPHTSRDGTAPPGSPSPRV